MTVDKPAIPRGLDPFYYALHLYHARELDACLTICTDLLEKNPYDKAAWTLKCKTLTSKTWIDDTEYEDEGAGDLLLDENAVAQAPRPGTSLHSAAVGTPSGKTARGTADAAIRPVSSAGRPMTGFARPGTMSKSRQGTSTNVDQALRGDRPGTSRPTTSFGRQIRLGTASMIAQSKGEGPFIDVERLDMNKYARREAISRALCDYLFYHEQNPRKAAELAAAATKYHNYSDWWWKARLGKAYYQLGMLRDAEKQFRSSLRAFETIPVYLELGKVFLKLDQPNSALDLYQKGAEMFPGDPNMLLGTARVHDMLGDTVSSSDIYKKVIKLDASNVEAIASLAANHFYTDQPEVALKYYRRLLQMGVNSAEVWQNLGLCCFYAAQYDMTLPCFEKALSLAEDDVMPDVWFNISHIAIGIGDLGLAYQALRVASSVDNCHAESYNNLGVLEVKKNNAEGALSNFQSAKTLADHLFEPYYNAALIAHRRGNLEEAFQDVSKALDTFPNHTESLELKSSIQRKLETL
eukprot:gb/GECG01000736.1/.p1 GENE.gb/GECG01000736.1/~~gb/GECG01000736.1/.p1  ORF type:complete len:522 (+),score=58.36 gb/GECG01000736.1/:1-1566(+)